MTVSRALAVAFAVALAVAFAGPSPAGAKPRAVEAPPQPEEGGSARGRMKNGEEVSPFLYAYAVAVRDRRTKAEEIHVVVADQRVPKSALDDLAQLSDLGAAGELRGIELVLDAAGSPLRLLFHHPGLPAGIAVQGVDWQIETSGLPKGPVQGKLVFDLPDEYSWTARASFETPLYRPPEAPTPAIDPDLPADERARRQLEGMGIEASEEALLEHAFEGDEEAVALLLAAGVPATARGGRGSALDDAIGQKHLGVAKALLAAGADPDEKVDTYGTTILHRAVDTGDPAFVAALLEAGATASVANQYRITPLMSASLEGRLEIVKLLIAAGAKVTARDTSGGTALSSAVLRGHVEVVEALLAAGADVQRDRDLLLELAQREGHAEVERVIREALGSGGG